MWPTTHKPLFHDQGLPGTCSGIGEVSLDLSGPKSGLVGAGLVQIVVEHRPEVATDLWLQLEAPIKVLSHT